MTFILNISIYIYLYIYISIKILIILNIIKYNEKDDKES
jgi:hypothetical protein